MNPQALKRYSYVLNNPLKYTDPSGHGWFKKLRRKVSGFFKALTKPKALFAIAAVVAASAIIGPAVSGFVSHLGIAASATPSLTMAAVGSIAGGAAAGAVGGAAAAAIMGGDIGKGFAMGAFSGAAFGTVGAYYKDAWSLGRVAASGVAGGTVAQVSGGKFKDGAFLSAMTAGARYLYNKVVGYGIRLKGGKFVAAKGRFTRPVDGANNIGEQGFLSSTASRFKGAIHEGGAVSRFANRVPYINAIAGLHDVFQVSADQMFGPLARSIVNIPGMPIAGAVTFAGAMADPVTASYLATDRD